jgi:hemerythrin-like domain-containing protein
MGEILAEHDEGRRLALQVRAGAERLVSGDLTARAALAWNALTYARLIKLHIAREETALFPLAGRKLSTDQQAALAREFERIKAEQSGKELHQRCVSLAQSLRSEARSA